MEWLPLPFSMLFLVGTVVVGVVAAPLVAGWAAHNVVTRREFPSEASGIPAEEVVDLGTFYGNAKVTNPAVQKLDKTVDSTFDKIDTDGSGEMSPAELRQQVRGKFQNIGEAEVKELLNKMDSNGDGKVSRAPLLDGDISFKEFRKAIGAANKMSDDEMRGLFNQIDVNPDGMLSRAEFVQAQKEAGSTAKMPSFKSRAAPVETKRLSDTFKQPVLAA